MQQLETYDLRFLRESSPLLQFSGHVNSSAIKLVRASSPSSLPESLSFLERLLRALRSILQKTSSLPPDKTVVSEAGLCAQASVSLQTPSTLVRPLRYGTRLHRSRRGSSTCSSTNPSLQCKSRRTSQDHASGPLAVATSIAWHSGMPTS